MNPSFGGTDSAGPHRWHDDSDVAGEGFSLRVAGTYARSGDLWVPEWLELTLDGDADGPTVTARVEVRDDAPRLVDLHFRAAPDQGEVRQAHLRETQVESLWELVGAFSVSIQDLAAGNVVEHATEPSEWVSRLDEVRRSRANRKMTDAFLREVAQVYSDNIDGAPTQEVKKRYLVSERRASGYVQEARKRGLLPPTTPGKKKGL